MSFAFKRVMCAVCFIMIFFSTSCNITTRSNDATSSEKNSLKVEGDILPDDENGVRVISKIITGVTNNDVEMIENLFAKDIQSKNDKLKDEIYDMLSLFSKNQPNKIYYEYSVQHNDIVGGDNFDYDECLAFVYTKNKKYSFDMILCNSDSRSNNNIGLWTIIVSDSNIREKSNKFDKFYSKLMNNLSDISDKNTGVFLL